MDASAVGVEDDNASGCGLGQDGAGDACGADRGVGVSGGDGPLDRCEAEAGGEAEGLGVPGAVGEAEEAGGAAEGFGEDGAGAEQFVAEAFRRVAGEVEVVIAVSADGEEGVLQEGEEVVVPFGPSSADEEGGWDMVGDEEVDDGGVEAVGGRGGAEVEGEVDGVGCRGRRDGGDGGEGCGEEEGDQGSWSSESSKRTSSSEEVGCFGVVVVGYGSEGRLGG